MRADQVSIRIDPLDIATFSLREQKDEIVEKFNKKRIIQELSVTGYKPMTQNQTSSSKDATKVISSPGSSRSPNASPRSSKRSTGKPDQLS